VPAATKIKVRFKWREQQLDWYWYWINERHRIYVNRFIKKQTYPWTKDKILRNYKFTNAFRQLDRVTEAWSDRFCRLLSKGRGMTDGDLLFQLCQFRFFNWPETYDALFFGMSKWNAARAIKILDKMREDKKQIFTGAYIITAAGLSKPKHQVIVDALQELYEVRDEMAEEIVKRKRMEFATKTLGTIMTVGPFIGYEIACDLRHTRLLAHAKDVLSWANAGPGAKRGIHRLLTGSKDWNRGKRPDYNQAMRALLKMAPRRLEKHVKNCEWPFEMREIEHSLCEFDKYMRVKRGEGRPRSRYQPRRLKEEKPPWE
jgi:hypothetical protein